MDGGPFRASGPTDRRVVNRPEPTHRQPEELQSMQPEPKVVHRATAPHRAVQEKKSFNRFIWPIVAVVIIIVAVVGWFVWSSMKTTGMPIDTSKYQAVFFTNGQVYFGKLQATSGEYMKLTNIYYLQGQQTQSEGADSANPQTASTDQNNVQLIKLGDEIHGPEDEMIISKDQVLFYENLKADGKVAQSIEKHKSSK